MRVGIVFGGRSAEHEVSIMSARSIVDVLDRTRYSVVLMAIDKWGRWWFDEVAQTVLERGSAVISPPQGSLAPADLLPPVERLAEVDICIPVLHGPFGEDGTIQGLFEMAGIPYVGCGVAASAVAMDKVIAKDVFRARGLPILPYTVVSRRRWEQWPEATIAGVESVLRYPMFVKPANLGSSVGITKVRNASDLRQALATAAQYDAKIVAEQGIEAREIEVSVLGNDAPEASIPGEILPSREFYSYEAKYLDDASELLIPAPLTAAQTARVQDIALKAFRSIDGTGLARVDFLMDRDTEDIYLNEVNTFPGFTRISMYPKLWEASGLPYPRLLDTLIALGMERHAERQRNTIA